MLMLHMAFGPLWTTILPARSPCVPALATRMRTYPVLGWLSRRRGARRAWPHRLRPDHRRRRSRLARRRSSTRCCPATACRRWPSASPPGSLPAPPAAGRGWSWKRRRRCLRCSTLAMLVRHAMNGGVIDTSAPTLAEQAIYTLIAHRRAARSWSRSTCARRARCCASARWRPAWCRSR